MFSRFKYEITCPNEAATIAYSYIEPLAGGLRHPGCLCAVGMGSLAMERQYALMLSKEFLVFASANSPETMGVFDRERPGQVRDQGLGIRSARPTRSSSYLGGECLWEVFLRLLCPTSLNSHLIQQILTLTSINHESGYNPRRRRVAVVPPRPHDGLCGAGAGRGPRPLLLHIR